MINTRCAILNSNRFLTVQWIPCVTGTSYHPTHRLEKVIPAYFDIRRDITNQRRPSPPKHDVFSRRLQLVVHYLERPWTVPANNRLGVLTLHVDVRDIGINHRQEMLR